MIKINPPESGTGASLSMTALNRSNDQKSDLTKTPPTHGIEAVAVEERPEAIPSAKLSSVTAFDRGGDNLTHPSEPPSNTGIQAAAVNAQPIEARHVGGVEATVGAKLLWNDM